jgi:hypothetical protein
MLSILHSASSLHRTRWSPHLKSTLVPQWSSQCDMTRILCSLATVMKMMIAACLHLQPAQVPKPVQTTTDWRIISVHSICSSQPWIFINTICPVRRFNIAAATSHNSPSTFFLLPQAQAHLHKSWIPTPCTSCSQIPPTISDLTTGAMLRVRILNHDLEKISLILNTSLDSLGPEQSYDIFHQSMDLSYSGMHDMSSYDLRCDTGAEDDEADSAGPRSAKRHCSTASKVASSHKSTGSESLFASHNPAGSGDDHFSGFRGLVSSSAMTHPEIKAEPSLLQHSPAVLAALNPPPIFPADATFGVRPRRQATARRKSAEEDDEMDCASFALLCLLCLRGN